MNVAALISGGKDSIYAIHLAKKSGHNIKYLIGIESKNPNSYMYHVPNIELTKKIAEVMNISLKYTVTEGEKEEELRELKEVLKDINEDVSGVVSGALASNYQRKRIEKICDELNLENITPLWGVDEDEYMKDLINDNFRIIITSVSAGGLDRSWLGKEIGQGTLDQLREVRKKYGINLAGEGGEYETLVLDCPLYDKKIKIEDSEKKWEGMCGKLIIKKATF
ncbi:MAG: diphthine--ammonia ligase [Candidatus Aenigmatarchaeota archaeon]